VTYLASSEARNSTALLMSTRVHPRDRQGVHRLGSRREISLRRMLQIRAEHLVRSLVLDHRRINLGRVDRVDANAVRATSSASVRISPTMPCLAET
jgi:hypothetical protein